MKRTLSLALALILALSMLLAAPAAAANLYSYPVVYANWQCEQMNTNPPLEPGFQPKSDTLLTQCSTLHTGGAVPGAITIYRAEGSNYFAELLGTWQAEARDGIGDWDWGKTWWDVYPDIVMKEGESYTFVDSDPASWCYAAFGIGFGSLELRGVENYNGTLPEPAPAPTPKPVPTSAPSPAEPSDDPVAEAAARMLASARAGGDRVDLSDLHLTRDQFERAAAMADDPELVWLHAYAFSPTAYGVSAAYPDFLDEYGSKETAELEAAVAKALECVLPGMDQLQTALVLHDYLASHVSYDHENYINGTVPDVSYVAYGPLVLGVGVCEGYDRAYRLLLGRCGIETCAASSNAMGHAWTLVRLNGSWYHVDVTWDDPVPDSPGRSAHDYFLLSDSGIGDGNHNHYQWQTVDECTDTRYESDIFWLSSDQPIIFTDADSMWLLKSDSSGNHTLVCRSWSTGKETAYRSFREQWPVWGVPGSYWVGSFSGLCLWDSRLFYNDRTSVYAYDPADGTTDTVYTYTGGDGYVFGLTAGDDALTALVRANPSDAGTAYSFTPVRKHAVSSPFTDVKTTDSYFEAVLWAVNHDPQITKGIGGGKFDPQGTVTREQAVTFLWRAMGCPEPKTKQSSFSDVSNPNAYYYKPVLWATETGVTNGMGSGRFGVGRALKYHELLTFLWRAKTGKTDSGYGQWWYSEALDWAADGGLLQGTGLPSASDDAARNCPRCDVVTFLWRCTE